jgi:predicted Zn-dependent peptidase
MQTGSGRRRPFEIAEETLDNGLRVVVSQNGAAPIVAVNLWYGVGSADEEQHRTGLAHLFEHLMFEGSANVAPGEHFQQVHRAGGFNNATTSFDRTKYYQCVPVEHLDLVLWLEADRMGGLLEALTQESLDKQRAIVKNERRQRYETKPYGDAWERLYARLYPQGHPYHHQPIGSMEDLDAASLADVRSFFERHYAPNNAVLAIVGDLGPDAAFNRVRHWFSGIPASLDPPQKAQAGTVAPALDSGAEEVEAAVPEHAVFSGFTLPSRQDPALAALDVGITVLSAGRGSAFHARVIRPELAAQASGSLERGAIASLGAFVVLGRDGGPVKPAWHAMTAEISRLAEDGPTAAEVARAQAQWRTGWLDRVADVHGRADELAGCASLLGDPHQTFARYEAQMRVSPSDVRDAFAAAFHGRSPAVVRYRPVAAGTRQ